MIKRIFQLIIVIVLLISCEEKFANSIDNHLYRIYFDNNWSAEESQIDDIEFYLFGNDSINKFCNINLNIQNFSEEIGFKTFIKKTEKQLRKNEKLISSDYKSCYKMKYHEMIFEADYEQFSLIFLQRYIEKDSKIFVLTYTAEKDYFDANINEVNGIFDTFVVK